LEISKKISGGAETPAARGKFYDIDQSTYGRYEKGANIPNDLLEKIASMGGDIVYILTGKRSDFQETLGNCRFGTGLAAVQVVGSNPTAGSTIKSLYSLTNKGLQAFFLPLPKVEFVENIN